MKTLNRRALLRGAGGAAIALPFLQAMGDPRKLFGAKPAYAASGFPKRLIFCITSNGAIRGYQGIGTNRWSPSGAPTAFDLSTSETLSPLVENTKNLLLIDGFDNHAGNDADGMCEGNPHNKLATQLVSRRYERSTTMLYSDAGQGTKNCTSYLTAGGISVDQELAKRIGGQSKFPSIIMYTGKNPIAQYKSEGVYTATTMKLFASWKGKEQAVVGEYDPVKLFNSIFGGGVSGGTVPPVDSAAQIARERSMLDAALDSFTTLSARVGRDDRARLDAHAEQIRSIERQIANLNDQPPPTLSCRAPTAPAAIDTNSFDNYPALLNVQSDLMVAAMACNLTQIGMLEWEPGFSELVHTWLGINKEHHGISHDTGVNNAAVAKDAQDKIVKINNYYAKELNSLLNKLKAIPEGTGTMLDNTAVVWMRELGEGSTHHSLDQAWIIGGTGGGYFKNNFWFKPTGADRTCGNLILHFLHMFGQTDTVFGDPQYCTGLMGNIAV